jgi:hypothetical protein
MNVRRLAGDPLTSANCGDAPAGDALAMRAYGMKPLAALRQALRSNSSTSRTASSLDRALVLNPSRTTMSWACCRNAPAVSRMRPQV